MMNEVKELSELLRQPRRRKKEVHRDAALHLIFNLLCSPGDAGIKDQAVCAISRVQRSTRVALMLYG
eukprot:scaffold2110_cov203-Alexandrium_tamarense.AAC.2